MSNWEFLIKYPKNAIKILGTFDMCTGFVISITRVCLPWYQWRSKGGDGGGSPRAALLAGVGKIEDMQKNKRIWQVF